MFVLGTNPGAGWLALVKPLVVCYYLAAPLGWKRQSAIWGTPYRKLPLFSMVCCLGILLACRFSNAPEMVATTLNVGLILFGLIGLVIVAASKPLICGYMYATGLLSAFTLSIATAFQHYYLAVALAALNLIHMGIVWRTEKALQKRPK